MISIQHLLLMLVFICILPPSTSAYGVSQQILQTNADIQLNQPTGNLSGYVTTDEPTRWSADSCFFP